MEDPKLSLTLMFPSGKLLKYLKFMIQIFEIAAECLPEMLFAKVTLFFDLQRVRAEQDLLP